MSRIFISHSSANNASALALSQWLEQQGWTDHFLDVDTHRGLAPGERWQAALAAAVSRCEAVLFLISPAWRKSEWCLAEFHQAKSLGKPIFGILVEAISLNDLPREMTSEWQLCNLVDGEKRIAFTVEKEPVVPPAIIEFASNGLEDLRIGLNRTGLDPSTFQWPPPQEPDRPPYPGLRALDAQDAAVFFGRDASLVRAMDQLRLVLGRGTVPLFVILGASGAGKSSFLRAGLLPRLKRSTERCLVLPVLRPERSALYGKYGLVSILQQAFAEAKVPISRADVVSQITSALPLAGLLRRLENSLGVNALSAAPVNQITERSVVLPIDQGEELFMADGGTESRELIDMVAALDGALRASHSLQDTTRLRLLVILTIRSDSMKSVQADPVLCQLSSELFSLPPMPSSEFKAVIEGPARRHSESGHSISITPALSELLIRDARGGDALPLLALTLEWLYREYGSTSKTVIGEEEYYKLGGVSGAIQVAVRRALERPEYPPVISSDSVEQQRLLCKCFPALATVDPDTGEPKRLVTQQDELLSNSPDVLPYIDRLVEQHLLVRDQRSLLEHGETTVIEVAHEALLRHWGAMEKWLAEYKESLMMLEALHRAANEWERNDRDPVLLVHSGHRLAAVEALRKHVLGDRLSEVDEVYLSVARQIVDDQMNEWEQQLKRTAAQQTEIGRQQQARADLQRKVWWGLALGISALLVMVLSIVDQTRASGRQESLVLTEAGVRADDDRHFDQGLRFGILAVRESILRPVHPNAVPQLTRAAAGSPLGIELAGHKNKVVFARFSRDGKQVVTASADRTAQVWDATSGGRIGDPLTHKDEVLAANFSPDGLMVVTASADGTAQIWNSTSGKSIGEPLRHEGKVNSAIFSSGGLQIVTASADGTAQVWDATTSKRIGDPLKHEDEVYAASFSSKGDRVITASADGTAQVWDAATGAPMIDPLRHEGRVRSASFSPNDQKVVTASRDNTARIWDAATGKAVGDPLKHKDEVLSANFSPDNNMIVTASADRTARVWDAATGTPMIDPLRHEGRVYSASFSPDGLLVVTASWDRTAHFWDATTGNAVGEVLWHEDEVRSASFSLDGSRVVTASWDRTARIWDATTGHPDKVLGQKKERKLGHKKEVVPGHEDSVKSASFSPDPGGRQIVTASADGTARIWDAATGLPVGKPLTHGKAVTSASFGPDGRQIVTASADGTAQVWDATSGKRIGTPLMHDDEVYSASFSPKGDRIITASWDKTARIWDAVTGQPVGKPEPLRHKDAVYSASFSPDGLRVVTASRDKAARIWDATTGRKLGKELRHEDEVLSASFSPDGQKVVTASRDKTAQIWEASTGRPVGRPLRHESVVYSASFSPDGQTVVTASWDETARVWDAATGQPVGEPLKHEEWVYSANFSPNGHKVITAAGDNVARIWDVRWSALVRSPDLVQSVCKTKLIGAARIITPRDAADSPILAGREGEDVCTGVKTD